MPILRVLLAVLLAVGIGVGLAGRLEEPLAPTATPQPSPPASPPSSPSAAPAPTAKPVPARPLAGVRIALDPGHQLGNHLFPAEISAPVPAGGFEKACNTTGTQTDAGVPEATINWRVARLVERRLVRLGATVRMTRTSNSEHRWGPCIDARGRFPGRSHAQLMVSIHADGAFPAGHGFHVIAPLLRPVTAPIAHRSRVLAGDLRDALTRARFARSTYVGDGKGLVVRGDLGTLNLSRVPVAMVELGNLRNAADAARLTSAAGERAYATALVAGISDYLGR